MPISFLEEPQVDEKLRARQFVREFASHRWGLFKESGFRSDYMYPPFSSLAGLPSGVSKWRWSNASADAPPLGPGYQNHSGAFLVEQLDEVGQQHQGGGAADEPSGVGAYLRGFDDQWRECKFETSSQSGLPAVNAQNCLPYLAVGHQRQQQSRAGQQGREQQQQQQQSFNLMSADPFSYSAPALSANLDSSSSAAFQLPPSSQPQPQQHQALPASLAHWRQLAESASWHFCGENFPALSQNQLANGGQQQMQQLQQTQQQQSLMDAQQSRQSNWFEHNQRTANKQNKLCHERSAFDIIKSSDDFKRIPSR